MHHISLTGYYTGILACGQWRADVVGQGDPPDTASLMPADDLRHLAVLARPDLCPACRVAWLRSSMESSEPWQSSPEDV